MHTHYEIYIHLQVIWIILLVSIMVKIYRSDYYYNFKGIEV